MSRSSAVLVALALLLVGGADVGAQRTFADLTAGLRATDTGTRLRAIRDLTEIYQAPDTPRRKAIGVDRLRVLPRVVPTEILTALSDAMKSPEAKVRRAAVEAFGLFGSLANADQASVMRSAIVPLLDMIRVGSPAEQEAAAEAAGDALRDCGADATASDDPAGSLCALTGNALLGAVNEKRPDVRRMAMRALGEIRYMNAAQALTDQLSFYERGPDADAALEGLAGIGNPTTVDVLERLLDSPNAETRRLAVEGLARAGTRDDWSALDKMAQSEKSNDVLLALHYAILSIDPTAPAHPLVSALVRPELRTAAIRYLIALSPVVAPALVDALQEPDPQTRMLVSDLLGYSGDAKVIPALEAASKDSDSEAALSAVHAIERIKLHPARTASERK